MTEFRTLNKFSILHSEDTEQIETLFNSTLMAVFLIENAEFDI